MMQNHAKAANACKCMQKYALLSTDFFNAFKWAGITGPTFGMITGKY